MDKVYYSTYVKLRQAIDFGYNTDSVLDREFIADSRSLLLPLHPESVNENGLLEFNIDLIKHYVSQYKEKHTSLQYQAIIRLVQIIGALLIKHNSQKADTHDSNALDAMNLKVTKDKPGLATKIIMYIVGAIILKAIYFGFFYKPSNSNLGDEMLKLQKQNIETQRAMGNLLK